MPAELMPWEDPPASGARTKEAMPWEDPVESVSSRVVRYDMPEPPGPPKIAVEPMPVPPGFGQRFYEQTLQGPVELARGLWNDPRGTVIKTIANLTAAQIQAAQHPLTLQPESPVIPIIEDVRTGNIPGAVGGGLGLATTVVGMERAPSIIRGTVRGAKATPTAAGGAFRGAYQAAKKTPSAAEYTATTAAGLFGGPAAAAKTAAALRTGRILVGATKGAREALNARAVRAAEALAAERAAAEQAAAAARPQPIPEARRIEPPPDTSYVRAVPAEPLPPSRQLPAPGRPAIITPEPEPPPSFVRAVPATPAEVLPQTLRANEAAAEAATGMREAMGLTAEQLREPTTGVSRRAASGRGTPIDNAARLLQEHGFRAADIPELHPPNLAALLRSVGLEGRLGKAAAQVQKRMERLEKAQAQAAKWQAAYDKLSDAEKAAVRGETEIPEPPAVAQTPPVTPAEALAQELGPEFRAQAQTEAAAAKTALSASEKRINRLAELMAEDPTSTADWEAGLRSTEARLELQRRAESLGLGKPGPGEIPKILDKVRELRAYRDQMHDLGMKIRNKQPNR